MFCDKCGAQNDDNNQVCYNCNEPLINANTPPVYAQQNNTTYQNQAYNPVPNPYMNIQPMVTQPNQDEHVSVGKWVGIFCINLIPCVGSLVYLIMLFVWAFGSTPKTSLKNFAKAQLIFLAIAVGLVIIAAIIMAVLGISIGNSYSRYY